MLSDESVRGMVFSVILVELGAIVTRLEGKGLTDDQFVLSICPKTSLEALLYPDLKLPPVAMLACIISSAGALLRAWAIRTLGEFFTLGPAIQPKQKLRMAGPYYFVRHPAYAGSILMALGQVAFFFADETYVSQCFAWSFPAQYRIICTFWTAFLFVDTLISTKRLVEEEKLLKKEFGKDWEAFERQTRSRLVPGIYWYVTYVNFYGRQRQSTQVSLQCSLSAIVIWW